MYRLIPLFLACALFFIPLQMVMALSVDLPFGNGEVGLINPTGAPSDVDGGAVVAGGANTIALLLEAVIDLMKAFAALVGILFLVIAGVQMVASGGEEEAISSGRRSVIGVIGGLLFLLMIDTLVLSVIYGGQGTDVASFLESQATIIDTVSEGRLLLLALLSWLQALVVVVAIGFLVYSGFRMVLAFGSDDAVSGFRTTVLWMAVGFAVLLLNEIIIEQVLYNFVLGGAALTVIYTPDATQGITEFVGILRYVLQFTGLIAIVAMVYGGALMLLSFGSDERAGQGRTVLISAAIGIIIILISYTLTSTLLSGSV